MQMYREYEWANGKVNEIIKPTSEERESQACQRRLKQMEKNRQKQLKKQNKILEAK